MKKLIVTVEIPVLKRMGKGAANHPISDEDLAKTVSYVLNTYLEMYCQNIGAPKLGPISANGKISESDIAP